jgi:hypothetical protein
MSTFEFFAAPSTPNRKVKLCKYWYHVLETIYLHVEGRNLGVTRDKLYGTLKSELIAYFKNAGGFICDAEIDLIEYLININFSPTVVRISKLLSILCNSWINSLNCGNMIKWRVSGFNGRFYAWVRDINAGQMTVIAEANIKNVVYRQLVGLISTIPDPGESSVHRDDFMDDMTHGPTLMILHCGNINFVS